MPPTVLAIATMDTKGEEIAFVAEQLERAGVRAVTVDVGTWAAPAVPPQIGRTQVAMHHPDGIGGAVGHTDRGAAVGAMGEALAGFLLKQLAGKNFDGVIGLGGSGGTALITWAMRALPVGLPKLMVSTVASGNVAPYVDCSDIVMMPSIVDVAGINAVSSRILSNAAHAMAGMVLHDAPQVLSRPIVGMTMFGVTTPCVTAVRTSLEERGFDCLVFHATGTGGRAMEKLVESGMIKGVLDITTTEVADEVVGGVFPAGSQRFEAILRSRVPCVMSLGALDMVNFGAPETVPAPFRDRRFHRHNAQVTLMRTTPDENRRFARWIAGKLARAASPVAVLIPAGGVSALDAPGQPFHDPEADAAFVEEFRSGLERTDAVRIETHPFHINDKAFADALVARFLQQWDAVSRREPAPGNHECV
jgi:uncharacterized protein (UPF0261 family)